MGTIHHKSIRTVKGPPKNLAARSIDRRYHSSRWRKARALHLAEHPLCKTCADNNISTTATVVDHRVPVRQGADFWDNTNYDSLCDVCHNKKRQQERGSINYHNEYMQKNG